MRQRRGDPRGDTGQPTVVSAGLMLECTQQLYLQAACKATKTSMIKPKVKRRPSPEIL